MKDIISSYFGKPIYLIILVFFIIFIIKKSKKNLAKKVLIAFAVFGISFPGVYFICKKFKFGIEAYRLFWIFPLSLLIGILILMMIQESKSQRKLWGLIVLIDLLMFGNVGLKSDAWKYPDNFYLISNEVIEISDIIESNTDKKEIIVVGEMDFMIQVRQYSSRISWGYTNRDSMIYSYLKLDRDSSHRVAAAIQDGYYFLDMNVCEDLRELQVDYVVLYQNSTFTDHLPSWSYDIIDMTNNYKIIKMNYDY